MSNATVLNFEKDVLSMTPDEVLGHIAYLRRTVAKRDVERSTVNPATLSDTARRALSEVAKSDREVLATLDALEASIRAQMHG